MNTPICIISAPHFHEEGHEHQEAGIMGAASHNL